MAKEKNSFIGNLASDLLRLEISTIIREEITARKVRYLRFALLELADDYRDKIMEIQAELLQAKKIKNVEPLKFKLHSAGKASYTELMEVSQQLMQILEEYITKEENADVIRIMREDNIMLHRIFTQSELTVDLFNELQEAHPEASVEVYDNEFPISKMEDLEDLDLDPSQIATVRKAHEIGTQRILMQTIIQVEGDIMTYVTPRFLMNKENEQRALLHVHNSSITTSIQVWKHMFTTIGSLAGGLFNKVVPGKKK